MAGVALFTAIRGRHLERSWHRERVVASGTVGLALSLASVVSWRSALSARHAGSAPTSAYLVLLMLAGAAAAGLQLWAVAGTRHQQPDEDLTTTTGVWGHVAATTRDVFEALGILACTSGALIGVLMVVVAMIGLAVRLLA